MNIETWKCIACGGEDAPCIVQIYFEEGKYGPLKDESRFRRRLCVCDNSPSPDWIKIDNREIQTDKDQRYRSGGSMSNVSKEVQKEVARIRDMISTTKALLPDGRVNFAVYEAIIGAAEKAVREQDTADLVKLLPQLKEMQ